MFALHRGAILLCAAAVVGCSPDSRSGVLAPSDVLTPLQLATSAADVPVYNFSPVDTLGVRLNAVNTAAPEHEASFTQDGHTMYFRCDELPPPKGGGNFQICVSRLIGTFPNDRDLRGRAVDQARAPPLPDQHEVR
jgi:hypothetical protein